MDHTAEQRRSAPARRRRFRLICPAFPAFNIYSRPAKAITALGPVCVATAVHDVQGWDVEVIDENNYDSGPRGADGRPDHEALQRERPADVVGFYGGLSSTVPRLYDVAKQYRRMGARTIAGGHHFVGENIAEALDHGIDVVVRGEGEEAIGELLRCFDAGDALSGVQGLAYRRDGRTVTTPPRPPLTDFDALPIPDFSVLRYARLKYFPVSGMRGCGMNCEFCAVKGRPRRASAGRMMEQFAAAHQKWGARIFFVVDDLFAEKRSETLRLCRLLKDYQDRVDVRFAITVQIRLDKAKDAELLQAMREAGVRVLAVGYESPIAEELRAMNKRLRPEEMIDLTRRYRRAGFRIHGMFIFGYPMRDGEAFRMSADQRYRRFKHFIRRARLDTVQVLLPGPLPGTELTRRLRRQGRIYSLQDVGWAYYDGNFPLFEPDEPLTAESMQYAVRRLMRWFYGPRHMLSVGLNVLSFPGLVFRLHALREGWRGWMRRWRTSLYRAGGWLLLRRWTADFKKDGFLERLTRAKRRLGTS